MSCDFAANPSTISRAYVSPLRLSLSKIPARLPTYSNAPHQPHKIPSHILTAPHLRPHTLNTIRTLALSLCDNPHILSNSGRNFRINGARIPAR